MAYPAGDQHRPRGLVGHVAGVLTAGTAGPATRIMLERAAGLRGRRLAAAVRDRVARRGGSRMRALTAYPGGRFVWRDVPEPAPPGPDAAVVHPIAVATCDLDRAMGLGRTPFPLPMRFGHECVAEVLSVGERVSTVRPGDRVVVPFQISCGTCAPCRSGRTANCASVPPASMYGFGVAGGHWGGVLSDQVAVPYADAMLVPLPSGVAPSSAASVADNVSDGYRSVAPYVPAMLARDPDASVLILSELGRRPPLSSSVVLYAGLVARALGVREVHFVDRRRHVRDQAESLGMSAHATVRGLPPAPLVLDGTCMSAGPRSACCTPRPTACASAPAA